MFMDFDIIQNTNYNIGCKWINLQGQVGWIVKGSFIIESAYMMQQVEASIFNAK